MGLGQAAGAPTVRSASSSLWRVALAKDLLRTERPAVAQVAQTVGYQSATAFTTAFARVAGCTPAEYARLASG
jgi:AraC-like DNA-binding protein